MQDAVAGWLCLHHNQSVNITTEMCRTSWRNRNAIRNGITDAVCTILGLYEIISIRIVQSRGITFQASSSFRLLLIKCKSQQFITVFYSLWLRSLLFKSAPEIVIWNFCLTVFPKFSLLTWFKLIPERSCVEYPVYPNTHSENGRGRFGGCTIALLKVIGGKHC